MSDISSSHIRVVGLSGSLRERSYTRYAVEVALQGATEIGAQTQYLDLRDYQIAFTDEAWESNNPSSGVERMRQEIRSAHGIILGTPEYHGSFSGVLKYALDLMGFKEFEGKLIGLVGVAGGKIGAINSLTNLRTVGRSLHAWVVPEQVSIPEAWRQFDPDGKLKNPQLEDALKEVGRQVARFAYLHHSEKAREFVHAWEIAPQNPGGDR